MKRLNNKGMTTVEVIICFVLVVLITVSMYTTISSYSTKIRTEENKAAILNYKEVLTKDIQDDFIKIGLVAADYSREVEDNTVKYVVNCTLKDGTERRLEIYQSFTESSFHPVGSADADDFYMIKYGTPEDMIEYPLPDIGSFTNKKTGKKVLDLSINNVLIDITDDNILSIYIGFYHPELTTKYAIDIVSPINFSSNSVSNSSNDFAGSAIRLNAESSANGSIQSKENGYGKTRGGVVGTLTLEEFTSEGTVGIVSDTGIVCTYEKGDGSPISDSKVKVVEVREDSIVKKMTITSNLELTDTDAIHTHCTATIVDGENNTKTAEYDGYIGNGWQRVERIGQPPNAANLIYENSYNWYYWQKGEKLTGEHSVYWYNNSVDPVGHFGTYYFFTGNENWMYYQNKENHYKKYVCAMGWFKKGDGKWYYYKDDRFPSYDYFAGELVTGGTFEIKYPSITDSYKSFTFGSTGICTAGQGC